MESLADRIFHARKFGMGFTHSKCVPFYGSRLGRAPVVVSCEKVSRMACAILRPATIPSFLMANPRSFAGEKHTLGAAA